MAAPRAVIVDDDPEILKVLGELVEGEGFAVTCAATLKEAREQVAAAAPDILVVDIHLPDGSGLELLEGLGPADPEIVLITGQASVETAVDALRRGASDYLTKPVDFARLKMVLGNLARNLEMKGEISALRSELRRMGRFGALIGASPPMQKVYDLIGRVARTDAGILITGETGTGKEVVAQTIHALSRRRKRAFLPVDCGAISATLIESELFGHERGSFTGADRMHKGYFERAHPGTLFLDEITEMSPALQVKLLRVLETANVQRIGADKPIKVDVRIIAATNRRPEEAVATGKLREDLLYRLNVFPIPLPPLRDRGEDVERLAEHFLGQFNAAEGKAKRFTSAGRERLRRHAWPGNLRELKNVVHHAFIVADQDLDLEALAEAASPPAAPSSLTISVGEPLAAAERRLILAALERFEGDKKKVAAALQISLNTLYNRLNEYKTN
ncbi:MAG TPA: sigma-54 dependent transcriptional regulator [Vicinamibacteria bacterium]|nr:sigma-54 dependent transcriptional regulator [Vicinamibacteria bacterium]